MVAGYSFLQHWIELEPDYIKLDRYYMADIANYAIKRRVLESLIKLIGDSTRIVIEGIEDLEGLKNSKGIRCLLCSGIYIGYAFSN